MTKQEIVDRLKKILDKADLDRDDPLTRKTSSKHSNNLEVLFDNLSILISSLRHDNECVRRELHELKKLLEEDGSEFTGMW